MRLDHQGLTFESVWDADFEGASGAEVKLKCSGGIFFLKCPFETFRHLVLVAGKGESQDQGRGRDSTL